jgi:hypothetical protein
VYASSSPDDNDDYEDEEDYMLSAGHVSNGALGRPPNTFGRPPNPHFLVIFFGIRIIMSVLVRRVLL